MRILLFLCFALPAVGTDTPQHYIVGGSDASISSYPHQMSLRTAGRHSCGASLIAPNRAVTVASCTGSAIYTYTILGGATLQGDTTCATCVLRDLTSITRHPGFDSEATGYPNDIAVLGFVTITFNSNLQPIQLANPTDGSFTDSVCTFTGWGSTSSGTPYSTTLQQAQSTVITNEACAESWNATYINNGHICISDFNATSCGGDWGGPLECGDKLAGASSWMHTMCDPAYPSVYTRISYFYDWIIAQ